MRNYPLVSIVIPTYNRPELLKRALRSCLSQTCKSHEIIIVNDYHIPLRLSDFPFPASNIKLINNTSNIGLPASRNKGLFHSNGEFVTFLDDDDCFLADALSSLLNTYYRSPYPKTFAFPSSISIGKRINARFLRPSIVTSDHLRCFNSVGNSIFIRRSDLVDVGGYDESYYSKEDHELVYRLCLLGFYGLKTSDDLHHIHKDHSSSRMSASTKMAKAKAKFFLQYKSTFSRSVRFYYLFHYLLDVKNTFSLRLFLLQPPHCLVRFLRRQVLHILSLLIHRRNA